MTKPKPARRYQMNRLPPRAHWPMPVSLTRLEAVALCEELSYKVSETGGALFTYPDEVKDEVVCRFEFHERIGEQRAEIRLGLLITVGQNDVAEVQVYISTPALIEGTGSQTEFSEKVVQRASKRAAEIVHQALERRRSGKPVDGYTLFHVEMPYQLGLTAQCSIADGHFVFLPTRIVAGTRISPVATRSSETSKEAAKGAAFRDISLLAALLTLANGAHYALAYPEWSKRQRRVNFLTTLEDLDPNKLYPRKSAELPAREIDEQFGARASWVWSAMQALSPEDNETFRTALFAFYAGRSRSRDSSTLSIVANVAALNKLAEDKKCACEGQVSCAKCGVLSNFAHSFVGDAAAITQVIAETMELSAGETKEMKKFIRRVYGGQRSSFVHGAELRHHEYGQGGQLHFGLPSLTGNAQEIAFYQVDLHSIMRITRRTLLTWLAKKSGQALDKELFRMSDGNLVGGLSQSGSLGLQPGIWSVLDTTA